MIVLYYFLLDQIIVVRIFGYVYPLDEIARLSSQPCSGSLPFGGLVPLSVSLLWTKEIEFLTKTSARWELPPASLDTLTEPKPSLNVEVWRNLPIELVTEILIYMAVADRTDAKNLCLVSSSIRRLISSCLYHNVLLRNAEQVTSFASPFLPKRSSLFLSSSSQRKPVSPFPIYSLALAVPARRPSIEEMLGSIGNAFKNISNLSITAPLLGAHAFWLRKHHVRPTTAMIFHLGLPNPVNFRESYFSHVTHLYTSTLTGFHSSSLRDLPALTHVALTVRASQPERVMHNITAQIRELLHDCGNLHMIVLSLGTPAFRGHEGYCYYLTCWDRILSFCASHPRFFLLPYVRPARLEWDDITSRQPDVFSRAKEWREIEAEAEEGSKREKKEAIWKQVWTEEEEFKRWKDGREWDLDLREAPGYLEKKSSLDWGETDTRKSTISLCAPHSSLTSIHMCSDKLVTGQRLVSIAARAFLMDSMKIYDMCVLSDRVSFLTVGLPGVMSIGALVLHRSIMCVSSKRRILPRAVCGRHGF